MLRTRSFYIVLLWSSHLSLKLVLKSVHTINPEALFSKSMNEIRLSGYMSSKKDFLRGPKITLTLNLQRSFKVTASPLTVVHCEWDFSQIWTKGDKTCSRQWFFLSRILDLHVETCIYFKVTAYLLSMLRLKIIGRPQKIRYSVDNLPLETLFGVFVHESLSNIIKIDWRNYPGVKINFDISRFLVY